MALYYRHPLSLEHDTGAHPENAGRIRAVEARLESEGWCGFEVAEAPAARREQVERVHTPAHVDMVEALSARGGGAIDADTLASEASYRAALRAAGAAAEGASLLLSGSERQVFCGLRPPGHHAEAGRAMGFCLFNNVAVAAAHAIEACGAERVMVVDWDVHHGNGTQEIFYGSDRVLFASIHQSPLYPGTGAPSEAGSGAGEGYTVNLPVPPGAGNDLFLALIQSVVVPIALRFEPDLLIVSAGYDAHREDPLAECAVDEAGYAEMAASLRDAAAELDVGVLVCLEGGYAPAALAASVGATLRALTDTSLTPRRAPAEAASEHRRRLAGRWSLS
ncbi:MAG: histone deacetylase [Solirubrobacterales bacterium]